MTDVMEEYKRGRFTVTNSELVDIPDTNLIILTDVGYWVEHYDRLKSWCEEIGDGEVRGMTVTCNDKTLTAFLLKWS
jgi:hypothetical protein